MTVATGGWLERFLGRGAASVTVPPLDGALKPNSLIEEARPGFAMAAPDNLALLDGVPLWSSGAELLRLTGDKPAPFATLQSAVTALTCSDAGLIAVACENHGISILDRDGNEARTALRDGGKYTCVTALAFAGDDALLICIGSTDNPLSAWQRDLLEQHRAGRLLRIDLKSGEVMQLANKLAFPNGVLAEVDGSIIVSESWAKRLIRLGPDGRMIAQVIEDLPGYPARPARGARGGYWLTIFAPRSPLIEFVLREPKYRCAMMAEVDPEYWIAPALRSGVSFHEPMQGGALKQMGILKPWAPTRSYGLVVEVNDKFVPIRSLHSRAGGRRHGITSALESGGRLWLTSKGGDEVVMLNL
jgi:hypothetical protein